MGKSVSHFELATMLRAGAMGSVRRASAMGSVAALRCARSSVARGSFTSFRKPFVPMVSMLSLSMSSTLAGAEPAPRSLHSFEGKAIDSSKVSMSAFAGKPVVMVNVASR